FYGAVFSRFLIRSRVQIEHAKDGERRQLFEGLLALSITRTSTGPFVLSSFKPSCSWTAVKTDGRSEADNGSPITGNSGFHCNLMSYKPLRSTLLMRVRSNCLDSR